MIKQDTPEWLEFRKNKIGASDAPTIMQVSPYSTPLQLWEQKVGISPPPKENAAMRRGHALEDPARLEVERLTGLLFFPEVKMHSSISYMIASVDGIDPEGKHIVEIKSPKQEIHDIALAGNIPDHYFPQLQHQMEVCEVEMAFYFSYTLTSVALVKVYRDDKYIKDMLQKEKEFWQCMEEFTPPEISDKDYEPKECPEWQQVASDWLEVNNQLKLLQTQEKGLREAIINMSSKRNAVGAGIRVGRFFKKGNVEYSAIPELQRIDLEKYRKNPIEYYRISPT